MKEELAMGVKCDGSKVVVGWFWETGMSFHPFVMKGDTCAEVFRICRQKRLSGWCVWRGAPEILFFNLNSEG